MRYDNPDFSDAGLRGRKIRGHTDLGAGRDGWQFDPRLEVEESDGRLVKKCASCFFGTDLGSGRSRRGSIR